jgi:hypothetical protein
MRVVMIVLLLVALVGGLAISILGKDERSQEASETVNQGDSFLVFRSSVADFAAANPGVSGEVQISSLSLPPWYEHKAAFRVFMASGYAYAWIPREEIKGPLAEEVLSSAGNSALIGFARSQKLFSPRDGLTAIDVPPAIPEDALVYVFPPAAGSPPAACGAAPSPANESRHVDCIAPQTGPGFTQLRSVPYAAAPQPACWVLDTASAGSWAPATPPPGACSSPPVCGAAPADYTESDVAACPNNPANTYTRTRPVTHAASAHPTCWVATPGAWSTPTAADCPAPPVCGPKPGDDTQSASCPSGFYGSRTLSASYSPAAHPTCWSLGAYAETANNCTACPGPAYETLAPRWEARTDACPIGNSGSITYEVRFDRRRLASYSCPAGTGALPAPTYGAVEETETAVRRNEVNDCVASGSYQWEYRDSIYGTPGSTTYFQVNGTSFDNSMRACFSPTLPGPVASWSGLGYMPGFNEGLPGCQCDAGNLGQNISWYAEEYSGPTGHYELECVLK